MHTPPPIPPIPICPVLYAIPKPKRRRTRSGCTVCKRRKIKCDEKTPCCGQCSAKALSCSYRDHATSTNADDHPGRLSESSYRSSRRYVFDIPVAVTTDDCVPGLTINESLDNTLCEQITQNIIKSAAGFGYRHEDVFRPLLRQSATISYAALALAALRPISAGNGELGHDEIARARTRGLKYQGKAIQLLQRDLETAQSSQTDAVLASTLLLALFEQAFDDPNSNYVKYLEGARLLIRQRFFLGKNIAVTKQGGVTLLTRILIKVFNWHDMMTILSHPFLSYAKSWSRDTRRLTNMLNTKRANNIFLLGWAQDIFWLMSDLALFTRSILSREPCVDGDDSWLLDMLPQASSLERRFKNFKVTPESVLYYMGETDLLGDTVDDLLATVELYRQTSLLYLYQVMPGLMPAFSVDEFAHELLEQLCEIPVDSPIMAYHGWILLTIGAQCRYPGDREVILDRLKFSHGSYRFASIAINATKLIQEIWRRRDGEINNGTSPIDARSHWTNVLKETGPNLAIV